MGSKHHRSHSIGALFTQFSRRTTAGRENYHIKNTHSKSDKRQNPKSVFYYSCDELSDYRELGEIMDNYLAAREEWGIKSSVMFLDEITFLEGWERVIKWVLDQGLLKGKFVYITGSSTAFLKSETFPGRDIRFIPLMPLNFLQYCRLFGSPSLKRRLKNFQDITDLLPCLLYTSPSPRDRG